MRWGHFGISRRTGLAVCGAAVLGACAALIAVPATAAAPKATLPAPDGSAASRQAQTPPHPSPATTAPAPPRPSALPAIPRATPAASPSPSAPAAALEPSPSPNAAPPPASAGPPPGFAALTADLTSMAAASGRHVGIRLVELQGVGPQDWSLNGGDDFTAASTYKLTALMDVAQRIAQGATRASDTVCYQDGDWEDGWFTDYADGACYTLQDLAQRAAEYSDNTAGHMLVREVGGSGALNQFSTDAGTHGSQFFDPNTTTASDLAALWVSEASGRLGGSPAQAWLYPLLTHTEWEMGIPAGVPPSATVVHKTGWIDSTENDTALVQGAPGGDYVLAICTDGDGSDAAWSLISSISARVWAYEATRQLTPPTPVPEPPAVQERQDMQ